MHVSYEEEDTFYTCISRYMRRRIHVQWHACHSSSSYDTCMYHPPPPLMTCMYPPPHITCMYPPPHVTCMYPPPHMTCMYPPPQVLGVCLQKRCGWGSAGGDRGKKFGANYRYIENTYIGLQRTHIWMYIYVHKFGANNNFRAGRCAQHIYRIIENTYMDVYLCAYIWRQYQFGAYCVAKCVLLNCILAPNCIFNNNK